MKSSKESNFFAVSFTSSIKPSASMAHAAASGAGKPSLCCFICNFRKHKAASKTAPKPSGLHDVLRVAQPLQAELKAAGIAQLQAAQLVHDVLRRNTFELARQETGRNTCPQNRPDLRS